MKILFDQNVPAPLRQELPEHEVATAYEHGWHTLQNGELLVAAETDGFEVLLTADQNLRYQQNLIGRHIATAQGMSARSAPDRPQRSLEPIWIVTALKWQLKAMPWISLLVLG